MSRYKTDWKEGRNLPEGRERQSSFSDERKKEIVDAYMRVGRGKKEEFLNKLGICYQHIYHFKKQLKDERRNKARSEAKKLFEEYNNRLKGQIVIDLPLDCGEYTIDGPTPRWE